MQHINYHAIAANANFFKQLLGKSKLCAVLKNNAYGHGIVRTASVLQDIAHCIAVGSVQEALLANSRCDTLILLPQHNLQQIRQAADNNFVLTVDSFSTLDAVQRAVGKGNARVHLKVNTGMNRLGFDLQQLPQAAQQVGEVCSVEGVFSHCFSTDLQQCSRQAQLFLQAQKLLQRYFPQATFHLANTAATLLGRQFFFDMARIGLGLFGYGASNLNVAKTVTATVVAQRRAKAGQSVGYDGAFVCAKDTNIAIVDCGYAKGFPRAAKGGKVQIGGKCYPIVGKVCMALMQVDTGDDVVRVGDQAILLGEGVNNANNDVIIYELLCNLE